MSLPALVALALALGYLLGSIPFGLLLTRAAGLGDIRSIGSGNIGPPTTAYVDSTTCKVLQP